LHHFGKPLHIEYPEEGRRKLSERDLPTHRCKKQVTGKSPFRHLAGCLIGSPLRSPLDVLGDRLETSGDLREGRFGEVILGPAYRHIELSEHSEDACRSLLERLDIGDVRGCLCCNLHRSLLKAMAYAEAPELYDPTDVVLKHIPRRPFPLP